MNRYVLAPAVALFSCTLGLVPALAQSKPAVKPAATPDKAAAAAAPAVPAKWVPPVKGVATGEIIEVQLKAPLNGQPDVNQMTFAHANGKVEAKKVTSLK
jgi:hypothetical protein